MVAEPASRNAAGPASGWGEYRRQMLAEARDVKEAVTACLRAGGGDSAGPMAVAALAIAALLEHGEAARRCNVDEARIEAMIARAVDEDRQAWPRPRGGRLRAVR